MTGHPLRILAGLPLPSRLVRLGGWALEEAVGAAGLEGCTGLSLRAMGEDLF